MMPGMFLKNVKLAEEMMEIEIQLSDK